MGKGKVYVKNLYIVSEPRSQLLSNNRAQEVPGRTWGGGDPVQSVGSQVGPLLENSLTLP